MEEPVNLEDYRWVYRSFFPAACTPADFMGSTVTVRPPPPDWRAIADELAALVDTATPGVVRTPTWQTKRHTVLDAYRKAADA